MQAIIIKPSDYKKEVWHFELIADFTNKSTIYFDAYEILTRQSTQQRKWTRQGIWTRIMQRDNTIKQPPLPDDVVVEARQIFLDKVRQLPIEG